MVRLAHLSDVHLTVPKLGWRRADWFNKRLAAWFNLRMLGRGARFRHADQVLERLMVEIQVRRIDHVVFSGDATALGFTSEIDKTARMLEVGHMPGLAVPGNHDYCTRPAAASGNFERAFAPWLEGLRIDGQTYPFAQKVGHVWLIGVNSSTGNRLPWDAGGAVGRDQLQRLARLLSELDERGEDGNGPRILVTHFPVCLANGKLEHRTHGLRDVAETVEVAAKGSVSLWLHGHRHGHYLLQESARAPFPIICGGSSTQTNLWSYGEYTIEGRNLTSVRRRYSAATGNFEDVSTFALELTAKREPVRPKDE